MAVDLFDEESEAEKEFVYNTPWIDDGFGIAVKTTGKNHRKTEAIAKILREKYGREW